MIRLALYAALIVGAIGGVLGVVNVHDARVRAQVAAAEAAARLVTERADHERVVAALEQRAAQAEARAAAQIHTREAIANAQPSNACSGSAAVRAALAGMRRPGGDRGAAPSRP